MEIKKFEDLSNQELYQILKLRSEIFVVEQECIFQDIDDIDLYSDHYFIKENNIIISYLRIYRSDKYLHIGRVCTKKEYRKKGYSKNLINQVKSNKKDIIEIHAQYYLKDFYSLLGFKQVSDIFLEDEIEHIEMILDNRK